MTAFAIGEIFGRFFLSYLIVFVVLLMLCKFDLKQTFKRSYQWYSIAIVFLIFVLGIAASASRSGAV